MTRVAFMDRTMSWRFTVRRRVRQRRASRVRTLQRLRLGSTASRVGCSDCAAPRDLGALRRALGTASAAWPPGAVMTTSQAAGALDALIGGHGTLAGLAQRCRVRSPRGLRIDAGAGYPGVQYECLGHVQVGRLFVEAIRVELSDGWQAGSAAPQRGINFLHMIAGSGRWRQGDAALRLCAGTSLILDGGAAHGFESVDELPLAYLWVAVRSLDAS